jgi:uncharacterized phage infection (PIP) family protein YhgE
MMIYFSFVKSLYTFFSSSTWNVLTDELSKYNKTLKRLSKTRFSVHAHDVIEALALGYENMKSALDKITNDNQETHSTRSEAACGTLY